MVKLAKAAKNPGKPKKACPPPPQDVGDSEEEESEEEEGDSSGEEEVPQKKAVTPAKAAAAGTPGKKGATPAKKAATPAKPVITPGKKNAAAKNGKKAQKKDSDEDDDDEEDDEEEDEDESESEEETPPPKKPTPKKPVANAEKPPKKKAAKKESDDEEEEDDDDDDEEEAMDTTPAPTKVKAAAVKAKESSEEEEEEEDDEEDEDEDDDDEEEKVTVKESGKRKKEVPKQKAASEAKKPKTEIAESFSLYVGNLNAEKDFDELKEAIRNFFTKKSLTVSDVRLGQTKKFGYVDFSCEEDLEKAVELSGKKILGVETKMEKARSKEDNIESKKERNLRTIFVKNLPYSTTSDSLQELFENAVEVRLPLSNEGSSRGIAYIEFKTEAEAEKAVEEKQGADVEGRSIVLDFTGDKAGKPGGGGGGDQKVLVINNLAYSVTESALQEVFEKAVSCKIPQNNQGRPKGFAFVEFTSAEDCKEALKAHNNSEIEGRAVRLELKGAQQGGRGGGSGQTKTLFVRGLSEDTTEESLKEAFEGAVGSRIATDRDTGSSKGFGFVDFSTVEDAKAAKEAMEDGEIDGNKVTLDFAKPKGEGGRGGFGRGGGRGFGRGRGFGGGYGGGRGGGGRGRGGGRGFGGGYGGGRGGGGGGGGFRGGNRGKKIRFDD